MMVASLNTVEPPKLSDAFRVSGTVGQINPYKVGRNSDSSIRSVVLAVDVTVLGIANDIIVPDTPHNAPILKVPGTQRQYLQVETFLDITGVIQGIHNIPRYRWFARIS